MLLVEHCCTGMLLVEHCCTGMLLVEPGNRGAFCCNALLIIGNPSYYDHGTVTIMLFEQQV